MKDLLPIVDDIGYFVAYLRNAATLYARDKLVYLGSQSNYVHLSDSFRIDDMDSLETFKTV